MDEIIKHAVEQAITYVMPVAVSAIVAGLGWLGKQAFTLLGKKIKESDTKVDDYLSGIAVKWAEDQYGPNTEKGLEKREAAIEYLMKNSKNKLTYEQAEALVRASYQSVFGNLGELKNGQAPLPTARPR